MADSPTCLVCTAPPTWEIQTTTIKGVVSTHQVCTPHAVDGHVWFVDNQDTNFAGPDEVLREVKYTWLEES